MTNWRSERWLPLPIHASDMVALESLDASSLGVISIRGLEYATSLRTLDLSFNTVKDLAPLAGARQANGMTGLLRLEQLTLDSNPISDISALAGLRRLTNLSIAGAAALGRGCWGVLSV